MSLTHTGHFDTMQQYDSDYNCFYILSWRCILYTPVCPVVVMTHASSKVTRGVVSLILEPSCWFLEGILLVGILLVGILLEEQEFR